MYLNMRQDEPDGENIVAQAVAKVIIKQSFNFLD